MSRCYRLLVVPALLFVVAASGCGAITAARQAQQQVKKSNDLKMLGLAYHNYIDANSKPPQSFADLESAGLPGNVSQAFQAEGLVVHWGIHFKDATVGSSNFVLAYSPAALQNGGPVCYLDGAVKMASGADIQSALANQKADMDKAAAGGQE